MQIKNGGKEGDRHTGASTSAGAFAASASSRDKIDTNTSIWCSTERRESEDEAGRAVRCVQIQFNRIE